MSVPKPTRGKALVKVIEGDKTTASGIVLPETAEKGDLEHGEVVALGAGHIEHGSELPVDMKVGDKVFFSNSSYDEKKLIVNGQKHVFVKFGDIYAIE